MRQANARLFLISIISPQIQLLLEHIAQRLNQPVDLLAPDDDLPPDSEHSLVLLDSDHVDRLHMQRWIEHFMTTPSLSLAALNVRDEAHAISIAQLHLQGIFYRQDSLALICKGIEALLAGDWWLSRSLMAHLIHFYRGQQLDVYGQAAGLTRREGEILHLLGHGATNHRIAGELDISDHTVRAHLYNLFRKIKVRNRYQAIDWARKVGNR